MGRVIASADVFRAISEPTRRSLLDGLRDGERSVGELVAAHGTSYSLTSQHLGVLLDAGVVERRARGRQRLYRLDARPLSEVFDWAATYAPFWPHRRPGLRHDLDDHA